MRKPTTLLSPTQASKIGKYTYTYQYIYRQPDTQTCCWSAGFAARSQHFLYFQYRKTLQKVVFGVGWAGHVWAVLPPICKYVYIFCPFFPQQNALFFVFFQAPPTCWHRIGCCHWRCRCCCCSCCRRQHLVVRWRRRQQQPSSNNNDNNNSNRQQHQHQKQAKRGKKG